MKTTATLDKIAPLKSIWKNIPKNKHSQELNLRERDIHQLGTLFQVGDFFYVIFNTSTAEMEFISEGVDQVIGHTVEPFDLSYVMNNIHPDDLPYYYHYEESAIRFFSTLDSSLLFSYKFSYDYRIKTHNSNYKRILQQIYPLDFFEDGGARTLGIFTDITHLGITGIPKLSFIGLNGAASYMNAHLEKNFHLKTFLFTKRESEILKLVVQGQSSEEISQKTFRSIHTIRTHRKNILQKSGCKNINELIVKAIREGWV